MVLPCRKYSGRNEVVARGIPARKNERAITKSVADAARFEYERPDDESCLGQGRV